MRRGDWRREPTNGAGPRAAAGDWRRARDFRQGLAGGERSTSRGRSRVFAAARGLASSGVIRTYVIKTFSRVFPRLHAEPLDVRSVIPVVALVDVLPVLAFRSAGRTFRVGSAHGHWRFRRAAENHRGVAAACLLHGGPPARAHLSPVVVRPLLAAHEGHRAEGLVALQQTQRGRAGGAPTVGGSAPAERDERTPRDAGMSTRLRVYDSTPG